MDTKRAAQTRRDSQYLKRELKKTGDKAFWLGVGLGLLLGLALGVSIGIGLGSDNSLM